MKIKNYLIFAKNVLSSTFWRANHPYKLTFAITNKCNLKCKTCYIWRRREFKELSFEEIDRFFNRNNFFNWIDLTGGEIFLRKDLYDISKSIKRNVKDLVMLHYPTNGFLTDRIVEVSEKIAALKFNNLVVTVSIDGGEEVHNRIKNNKGSFQRCIETYRELKKNKRIKVFIGCTLSPFNIEHFSKFFGELKDYLPDLKYSDIHLNIYHYSEILYSNKPLFFNKNKAINLIENFIKKKGSAFQNSISLLEYFYLKNIKNYLITNKTPYRCKSGEISCFIDSVGNVYPCSGFNVVLGNLRENDYDLLRILFNINASRVNKKIGMGECPHCWTPCEAYQNILSNLFIKRG